MLYLLYYLYDDIIYLFNLQTLKKLRLDIEIFRPSEQAVNITAL